MSTLANFLTRCDRLRAATDLSQTRLSDVLFGNSNTLQGLAEGTKSVTIRVFDRALERLDEEEKRRLPESAVADAA